MDPPPVELDAAVSIPGMTDTAPRIHGLKGRQPAVFPPGLHVAEAFLVGAGPAAPTYPLDVTGGVPEADLGMYGNGPDPTLTITTANGPGQPVGDCFFAAVVNKKARRRSRGIRNDRRGEPARLQPGSRRL